MQELLEVREKNIALHNKILNQENFQLIKQKYEQATNRLIILDYDGTLVSFKKRRSDAYPTPQILALLEKLCSDSRNQLVIISGRDRQALDKWLGQLPIGMAAEHGAFYKEDGEWKKRIEDIEWDKEILQIFEHTARRTPMSKIEVKDTALVWHYRNVDFWLAELRVNQLLNALINPCSRLNLQIMKGNKIVEVKNNDASKGSEAIRFVNQGDYDFIMAIGDDTTDEEMFIALPDDAITIKVGKS